MFYIVVSEKGGAERREAFEKTAISVGRVQDNDLALPKGNVSKRHCRIEFSDGRFVVIDEDSTNGTYVNRRRIAAPTIVREGDRVYVGDFVLRVELTENPQPNEQASQPEAPARVPQFVRPLAAEAEAEFVDFARTTAPADSVRPHAPAPPAPRRSEQTSAFPVLTSDLVQAPSNGPTTTIERAAARTLIEEVWKRLEPRALERVLDSEANDRVSRILAEQVQHLAAMGYALPPAGVDQALHLARSELFGLGPLESLLEDPRISAIVISGAKRLQVTKDGSQHMLAPFCHPESVEWTLARLCRQTNSELLDHETWVRRSLKGRGLHLEALRGSLSAGGPLVRLSRGEIPLVELDDLVHVGTLSRTMATFLRHCVLSRLNVLVVGKPYSGNQELLGALASLNVPPGTWVCWPNQIVQPPTALDCHSVQLQQDTDTSSALGFLLHMGQRIVTTNPPKAGLKGLIDGVAQGLEGLLVSQDGAAIDSTLTYWSQLLATLEVPASEVRQLLTHCFDVAVEVGRLGDGRSRVLRISEFRHRELSLKDIFDFVAERTATGGSIEGHFRSAGEPPALVGTLRARGAVIDDSLFLRPPSE